MSPARPIPAAVALAAALVTLGGVVSSPVQNVVSRAIEARADLTGLEATHDPQAFRQVQRQLALHSLADPTPPWFGYVMVRHAPDGAAAAGRRRCGGARAEMTRTLFVTNDFPPRRGGIETFVRQLCDDLPPDEVVVHTASMPGAEAFDSTLAYPVVRDPATTLLPTRVAGERVAATLRSHGCDRVLFGAAAPLGLMAPRLRAAGATHVTAVTHGHEVWWASVPGTRRLLRRIGDSVDALTYVSDYCRERIEPALSADGAARMTRLSPMVDRDRFHPGVGGAEVRRRWGIAADVPVVVCVARLVRRKGQDTLVRIWPEVLVRFPGAVLLLVGDGPDRARLERMVARRGLEAAVRFVGSVPWEEVPEHLGAADVFAMPCRDRRFGLEVEAFGIVFLEAAACGLPVVAGRSGGVADALAVSSRTRPAAGSAAGARLRLSVDRGAGVLKRSDATPPEAKKRTRPGAPRWRRPSSRTRRRWRRARRRAVWRSCWSDPWPTCP